MSWVNPWITSIALASAVFTLRFIPLSAAILCAVIIGMACYSFLNHMERIIIRETLQLLRHKNRHLITQTAQGNDRTLSTPVSFQEIATPIPAGTNHADHQKPILQDEK